MKQTLTYSVFALFLISIVANSCTTKCDCYPYTNNGKVTEYDVLKTLIQTNCTNFATGFETVFENLAHYESDDADSVAYAEICQAVINPVRFFLGESGYFFVESDNAWMVAHATKPELVGTYRYDVQDINGKYYVRDMVTAINYKGYGFVDYYFEDPEDQVVKKKLSFVQSIPKANFFIGTGFYHYYENNYFTPEEESRAMLEHLTKSMAEGLSGGMEQFTDSLDQVEFCRQFIDNIRFFDNQSGYFFIYDHKCANVAHATQKDLQGQNLYNYQDSQGNYVIRDLRSIIANEGHGFYEYYWNNPTSGNEEPKTAYVYRIPGFDYFIGSGYYY